MSTVSCPAYAHTLTFSVCRGHSATTQSLMPMGFSALTRPHDPEARSVGVEEDGLGGCGLGGGGVGGLGGGSGGLGGGGPGGGLGGGGEGGLGGGLGGAGGGGQFPASVYEALTTLHTVPG